MFHDTALPVHITRAAYYIDFLHLPVILRFDTNRARFHRLLMTKDVSGWAS